MEAKRFVFYGSDKSTQLESIIQDSPLRAVEDWMAECLDYNPDQITITRPEVVEEDDSFSYHIECYGSNLEVVSTERFVKIEDLETE